MTKLLFFVGVLVLFVVIVLGVYYLTTNLRFGDKKSINTDDHVVINKTKEETK